MEQIIHQLPQCEDVENALIGVIISQAAQVMPICASSINAECFYNLQNRKIYKAAAELFAENVAIDVITLNARLQQHKAGVAPYDLVQLSKGYGSLEHILSWIEIIKHHATRRNALDFSRRVVQAALDNSLTQEELAAVLADNTGLITGNVGFTASVPVMSEALKKYIELAATKDLNAYGVRPLLAGMRKLVKFWREGDLVIVAGRPGMGKTAITKSLVYDFAAQGKQTLFFSMEMSSISLADRIIYELADMGNEEISRTIIENNDQANNELIAKIDNSWREKFLHSGTDMLFINDQANITIEQVASEIEVLKAMQPNLSAVIIDYIGLIKPTAARSYSREQEVAHISRMLKKVAKKLSITIFALSQLSRSCEQRANKEPLLSDLRDSGAIEQDADIVLFLYRAEYYKEPQAECNGKTYDSAGFLKVSCAKFRNGSTGDQPFRFIGELTKVTDYTVSASEIPAGYVPF